MNLALLIFTLITSTAFLLFVWKKYGIQKSISASIYVLDGAFEKSLYSFFMLFIAVPMMLVSNTTLGWLAGFLVGIDFAAVTTRDNKVQSFLHVFGAEAGIAVGMIMLFVDFHQWYLVVPFCLFTLCFWLKKFPNHTWWIEVAALITVLVGLSIAKL